MVTNTKLLPKVLYFSDIFITNITNFCIKMKKNEKVWIGVEPSSGYWTFYNSYFGTIYNLYFWSSPKMFWLYHVGSTEWTGLSSTWSHPLETRLTFQATPHTSPQLSLPQRITTWLFIYSIIDNLNYIVKPKSKS